MVLGEEKDAILMIKYKARFIGLMLILLVAFTCIAFAGVPAVWIPRGPGGGGGFFGPAISPHDPDKMFVQSDMGELFLTVDSGARWRTLDFRQVRGGTLANVQFTSDPNTLYCINFKSNGFLDASRPSISTDAGQTWTILGLPGGDEPYCLFADPERTNRIVVSTYGGLYFSDDSGANLALKYSASDLHVAGALFVDNMIYVGTQAGLLVSANSGSSFTLAGNSGIPGDEAMVSFAGSIDGGITRLYCVTLGSGDVFPGVTGNAYGDYYGVYRLDYTQQASWSSITTGIGADHPFFVDTCRTNINIAYVAGAMNDPVYPVVYKTVNGGTSWQKVFKPVNNENIYTGWQGDGGDENWWYGEYALGFCVSDSDPNRAVITDLGYTHITTNGAADWYAGYVHRSDLNPVNAKTPKAKGYHSIGLEDTSCWWLTWSDPTNIFASFTDITATRTEDGGMTWSMDHAGLARNTVYQCLKHPVSGQLYASDSSVHDLFQSSYLTDAKIDGGSGGVFNSSDKGATWNLVHNFGNPVAGLALDPNNANKLYACVVHSTAGGIFVTSNLDAGASSTWTKLSNPPRTEGHPYTVHVLNDGTLVCSYSGRRTTVFTLSSGVFVSLDGGVTWLDRSHSDMRRWTKDLVVDPHDTSQQTWYAGVFSHWGAYPNEVGGLYKTTNRGVSWTPMTADTLYRVESCTISPSDSNTAFITTELQGLWVSTNFAAATPTFEQLAAYPFAHPVRVFFNPYDNNEVWITSFGNGMYMGRIVEPQPTFTSFKKESDYITCEFSGASGQGIEILSAESLLGSWTAISTQYIFDASAMFKHQIPQNVQTLFYKGRVNR